MRSPGLSHGQILNLEAFLGGYINFWRCGLEEKAGACLSGISPVSFSVSALFQAKSDGSAQLNLPSIPLNSFMYVPQK